jgi:cystathionine gamma-synthase
MSDASDRFETIAVHAGAEPDLETGAVSPPIVLASTFAQDAVGHPHNGWEYGRSGNPTRARLERAVAALEGGRYGIAFASGSAASAAIAELATAGDEILVGDDVYGGTYRLLERVVRARGIDTRYVDLAAGEDRRGPAVVLAAALTTRTRIVWFETPSNPLLKVTDIAAVAAAVRAGPGRPDGSRPLVVVDGTFASPAIQRPLALGADVVFHSSTKYLGGHSDTIGGIAVTSDDAVAERLRFLQNALGAVPSPFECFLVLRGLRTLAIRVERHAANAATVAAYLASRDDVASVHYPGITEGRHAHPGSGVAARQMAKPGGMISFVPAPAGGRSAAERAAAICASTRLFTLAESLGGVESLIEVPAAMTHASVAGSQLAVDPALVRLSVGIEAADDLVEDLRAALDASAGGAPAG